MLPTVLSFLVSMFKRQKSNVFQHFTLTGDGKLSIFRCNTDGDETKPCDSMLAVDRSRHRPSRASSFKRYFKRNHVAFCNEVGESDKKIEEPFI